MKRKSDYATAFDDMFGEDDKKKLAAIKLIREIAANVGPARVRNQLLPFLSQFIDDEVAVMLAVLEELTNFTTLVGGSQHEKLLLPLLISFCKLDEKEVAKKAMLLMEPILEKNPDENIEAIRKLSKPNMNVSKQCAMKLIINGLKSVPHLEPTFLQIYNQFVYSDNPSIRIIAAKHFKKLAEVVKNLEHIAKIAELIFNDAEDLVKLYCAETLIELYVHKKYQNMVMNKLKYLFSLNTWRINLKLCQMGQRFVEILSKTHFQVLVQPAYLKLLTTEDDQIRAASCSTLIPLTKCMSQDEIANKVVPILKKLSQDKVDFVRIEFAHNLVKLVKNLNPQQIKDIVLPIVMELLKQNKLELSYGVLNNFQYITEYISEEKQEAWLFQPLKEQLDNSNWRLKSKIIEILGRIVTKQKKISSSILKFFFTFVEDKVEAVRNQAALAIIEIIKKNCANQCECDVIGDIIKIKGHPSYLIRQKLLMIIQKTLDGATLKYMTQYRKVINAYVCDPIPNIKLKVMKILTEHKKLWDKNIEREVERNRNDADAEVQKAAKQLKQ